MMLRDRVRELMVRVHRISPELAASHVRQMSPSEVKRRFLMYVLPQVSGPVPRVAKGAIGNLTIDGMGDRAGKPVAHAGSREFPRREPECSERMEGLLPKEGSDHPGFGVASGL
jgi:hypothetical protein